MLGKHIDEFVTIILANNHHILLLRPAVHSRQYIFKRVVRAEEDSSFAELNILLQVVAYRLADAVVVHCFRHSDMQIFTHVEEMIRTGF